MCLGSCSTCCSDASAASMEKKKNPELHIQLLGPLVLIEIVDFLNEVIITY